MKFLLSPKPHFSGMHNTFHATLALAVDSSIQYHKKLLNFYSIDRMNFLGRIKMLDQ